MLGNINIKKTVIRKTLNSKQMFALNLSIFFCVFSSIELAQNKTTVDKQIPEQEKVIRVNTDLVNVPVTVFDRDGRYITNLKKEDFQIFEDGVEQEVTTFETINQPITVFLLLDISGSMTFEIAKLANAASVFVNQLKANDQLTAATFDDQVNEIFSFKSVADVRKSKKIQIRVAASRGDTMVYDAVDYALKKMQKVSGRKAIILFSDGVGRGYAITAKDNLRKAEENKSLIYSIRFNSEFRLIANPTEDYRKKVEFAKTYMNSLSQITGGRSYQLENIEDLDETFASIAKELSQQYCLSYYPKRSIAGSRQIKVKVRQPNLAVRARSNYVSRAEN